MKKLLLLFIITSCAHNHIETQAPSWVSGLRSGEEKLKVTNGSKTYYRRIAGGPSVSRQTACELVVMKAEEDIKKERPLSPKVPYTVEVLYYDDQHRDCAVTLALDNAYEISAVELKNQEDSAFRRRAELLSKDIVTEDEAAEIINLRSEIATRYALTGASLEEFEKFSKEKVSLIQSEGLCTSSFRTDLYSIHGKIQVCWKNDHIEGYCTPKSSQCWIRSP